MAYIPPTDWELRDFFREHVDSLYRSCMLLTGGRADAQAMVKEIFLDMLNHGMEFSSSADAKAWMILKAYKMRRKAIKASSSGKVQDIATVLAAEEPSDAQNDEEAEAAPEQSMKNSENSEEDSVSQSEVTEEVQDNANEENVPQETVEEETSAENSDHEVASDDTVEKPEQQSISEDSPAIAQSETVQPEPIQESKPNVLPAYPPEILKLSAKDRLIALLYYCEGYRKSEIANYLGCPTFVIRSKIARLKRKLVIQKGEDEAC